MTTYTIGRRAALVLAALGLLAVAAHATDLRVMTMGLGSGSVTSNPAGIACGGTCDAAFSVTDTIVLTATADAGSVFSHWEGDAAGASPTASVSMSVDRSVRAVFDLATPIAALTSFTPAGIQAYLTANPAVNTPGRFVSALPVEFKRNWILMTRSESLQTGTAEFPRMLLPSANAQAVFTVDLVEHASYPGAHPDAVEYMQWDPAEKNFRFHEIVLDNIPAMGVLPARTRGVSADDSKCFRCHSTRNVLNPSPFPGTTGVPPGTVKAKNKPNWDTYDSWAGMTPFNRDRIYQGTVEAATFRRFFDPWTWRANPVVRPVIEQLDLQPPGVPPEHVITRVNGGVNDGHVQFDFDGGAVVLTEPAPTGSAASISTNYGFDKLPGSGATTSVVRGGPFVTLHHSGTPTDDEGRGVQLFDLLGGLDGNLNQTRVADELVSHHFATGSVPIDIRPVALAISKGLITIDMVGNTVTSSPPLTVDLGFFVARHGGMTINEILADTTDRARSIPRRKADIQKMDLDRAGDIYVATGSTADGMILHSGAATSAGTDTSLARLRQDVFRRPIDLGSPDSTVMGGIYVDRELPGNFPLVALYRFFLEPLGVSVDKWSMGVRGRSRTYTFADIFGSYTNEFVGDLTASLISNPVPGLTDPSNNTQLINAVNSTLSSLPAAAATPTYTDVQRVFNKGCIECHGGLNYPPYANYGTDLDLSEDENPPAMSPPLPSPRLARAYNNAVSYTTSNPATSFLFQKITRPSETCPDFSTGMMPCGGPVLSKVDVETIRRWIVGPPSRPSTNGDPHVKTVEGIQYDFQADGEFVFLQSEHLEIQVRQMAIQTAGPLGPNDYTGLTSCVSVNSAVAVRVGGHRITYQPDASGKPDPEGLELRIDGHPAKLGREGIALAGGGRVIATIAPHGIQVEAPGDEIVVITPGFWDHYQVWYLNVDTQNVRALQGLAGAIAPNNWLPALPDGKLLGPPPAALQDRYDALYHRFGDAWRVSDATSLFDYAPGTSTSTFTLRDWPGGESPNSECKVPGRFGAPADKRPQEPLAPDVIKRLIAEVVDPDRRADLEADLRATGEAGFAQTYLWADRIARNKPPAVPALDGPADDSKGLDTKVALSWRRISDPDGDPVTYLYSVWPADKLPDDNAAIRVAPATIAADAKLVSSSVPDLVRGKAYYWKVIAEDDKGARVESETRRFEVK